MGEGTRILGVDDSLTIRKALELVLKPAGYNLELAASGAEAIEKAKQFRPAILLLDFILPDMRGTEVCKHLSADPATAAIPVVLISAKGAEIRQAYQDVGNVVNYITKPFTPEDVTGIVSEVLAQAQEAEVEAAEEAVPAAEVPAVSVAPVQVPGAPSPPSFEPVSARPRVPSVARPIIAPFAPAPPAVAAEPATGEAWEEVEESEEEVVPAHVLAERREVLEVMFESLRAGLEGVYVEEVDTPAGAAADEARTYTDLVSRLARQLGETLDQARSGTRFALSSDGSVRSLDDNLFDAYRRFCRVLFRAATAGAVVQEVGATRARVLVACRRDSDLFATLCRLAEKEAGWHGFMVCERFRQLPIMTRVFGPTHIVAEISPVGALMDQIATLRAMPEARRFQIIGVSRAGESADAEQLSGLGIRTLLRDGPDLWASLCRQIIPGGAGGATAEEPAGVGQEAAGS
jgi:CheY-like chemotaxis protein